MGLSLEQALYRGDGVQSLLTAWRQVHGYSWWDVCVLCVLQMGGEILDESAIANRHMRLERQQWRKGKVWWWFLKGTLLMRSVWLWPIVKLFFCFHIRGIPQHAETVYFLCIIFKQVVIGFDICCREGAFLRETWKPCLKMSHFYKLIYHCVLSDRTRGPEDGIRSHYCALRWKAGLTLALWLAAVRNTLIRTATTGT